VLVELPNGVQLDEIGKLVFGDNRIDPSTGTLTVRAVFDNAQTLILDGSFVNISIESAEPVDRLLVPQAAVQRDQKGDFVLVVTAESTVEQRYITTAGQHETALIVAEGLREGETVIVEGLQRVRPGVPVEAVLSGTEG
jgi:membrane fusion protein (multidrug efflux system)